APRPPPRAALQGPPLRDAPEHRPRHPRRQPPRRRDPRAERRRHRRPRPPDHRPGPRVARGRPRRHRLVRPPRPRPLNPGAPRHGPTLGRYGRGALANPATPQTGPGWPPCRPPERGVVAGARDRLRRAAAASPAKVRLRVVAPRAIDRERSNSLTAFRRT